MIGAFIGRPAAGGGGGPSALSTSGTVSADAATSSNAEGDLTFASDGSITKAIVGTTNNSSGPSAWLSAVLAGNGAAFWIRATLQSGTLTSGTTGSWLQGNANRTWVKGPVATGADSAVLLIEIATDAGGATIVASGTWTVGYSHSGGSGATPALSSHSVGGDVSTTLSFNNDGTLSWLSGPVTQQVFTGQWLTATGTPANYELVLTYVSGPNPSNGSIHQGGSNKTGSAYATALNLGTTRTITITAFAGDISGTGGGVLVFDAAIRPAGGGATLASARFTLSSSTG